MKKILTLALLFVFTLSNAQDKQPTYEKAGDMVKATYYYTNGSVKEQGFFKDKKLAGEWVQFDKEGKKTMIAHYKAGKKVGKWFAWSNTVLKEINYKNNVIVSVRNWNHDSELALNKEGVQIIKASTKKPHHLNDAVFYFDKFNALLTFFVKFVL